MRNPTMIPEAGQVSLVPSFGLSLKRGFRAKRILARIIAATHFEEYGLAALLSVLELF